MNSQQPTPSQPPVKKVLIKRVKVLVKRPVASPSPAAAPAIPAQREAVQSPYPAFTQSTASSVATPQRASASGRKSYVGQTIDGIKVQPITYTLANNVFTAVEKCKRIHEKLFTLYINALLYAEQIAQERGYTFPAMQVELPYDTMQLVEFAKTDPDVFWDGLFNDFTKMAPFINGLADVLASKKPPEEIIDETLNQLEGRETTTDEQIVLAYLSVQVDLALVAKKLTLKASQKEITRIIDDIKGMQQEEKDTKKRFIEAIERKHFPVDAEKLINNYFTLSKKDPDKAYETLITNPLFFSPIQPERMSKKLFGSNGLSPKEAMAVNKQLASFLKNLKA